MRRRYVLGILVVLGLVLALTLGATSVAADCVVERYVGIDVDCHSCPDSGFLVTIKDSGGNVVFQELTGTDGQGAGHVDEYLCPGDYTYTITKQCYQSMSGSFTIHSYTPFIYIERDTQFADTTPPAITCPANVTVPANSSCTATNVNLGTPVVSDPCDPNPTVTNNAPGVFPLGETIVTWTARDASGNQATCAQKVTVVDQTPPTITCPADLIVPTVADCQVTFIDLGQPTVADNCGIKSVTNNAVFPMLLGETIVTWTVEDNAGNKATCAQKVTVVDQGIPTITCPADVSVQAGADCTATNVNLGTPVTADNCSVASVTNNAPAVFPLGDTTVTWTVKDPAGNQATCTQKVTVFENTVPVVEISSPGNGAFLHETVSINGTVTDNNNFSLQVRINGTVVATSLPFAWDTTAYPDGPYWVEVVATDCAGNTGSDTANVTVDNTAPLPPIITGTRSDSTGGGDQAFRLLGVEEDNARVQIWAKGPGDADFEFLGACVADVCGRWVFNGPALAPGTYVIRAGAKDAAGNWSGWSDTFELTINPGEFIEVEAFQQGEALMSGGGAYAGTVDTTISSYEPGASFGGTGELSVRQGDVKAALVKFDLSAIPADWTVKHAVLAIYVGDSTNNVRQVAVTQVAEVAVVGGAPSQRAITVTLFDVLASWSGLATWNSPWAMPGANGIGTDRGDVALASAVVNMDKGWVTFEITDEVAKWLADPAANNGVILKGSGDASVEYAFRSSEWWEVCRRPRLMLTLGHQ